MDFSRGAKRSVIASVYIALTLLLGTGAYFSFFKAPETCFDKKQNQDEGGIDCGGVCQAICQEKLEGVPLVITEAAFVPAGNGQYDVLGQIYNPNDEIGVVSFSYSAEIRDQGGTVIASREGKSYILPQEKKYLIELNLSSPVAPEKATFRISGIEWARFSGYQAKPDINIYQKRYSQISSGTGFSEAYGLLANESPYDFRSIIVRVIVRDSANKPLALNVTEMRTVKSREERDFRLVWPSSFPGTVEKLEMEVDADVYHSENFTQQYLPGGKFQEFSAPRAY